MFVFLEDEDGRGMTFGNPSASVTDEELFFTHVQVDGSCSSCGDGNRSNVVLSIERMV